MVGASVVAAAAVRVAAAAASRSTVRNDLAVAVATLCGSTDVRASMVGLSWELSSGTVATEVSTATCSFVVAVPSEWRLVNPVVDPHEVGVFSELGDDFSSAYALSLACDRCDRHEALLGGSVYSALDCFESFRKVADGEVVSELPAPFVALPVALTSASLLAGVSSADASADSASAEMSSRYLSVAVPDGPGVSPAAMKTWRSGVPRLDSVLATSVGVFESARARGVPSWNGSESM
jgi:hypothetical protein